MVRPVAEFGLPAYHSLFTKTQTQLLERLQSRAMKIIFGWSVSYATALRETGTEKLEERRTNLVRNFAIKCTKNERFRSWFPTNPDSNYNIRRREKYRLVRGRTSRYQKNPLYYMKTLLNQLENWSGPTSLAAYTMTKFISIIESIYSRTTQSDDRCWCNINLIDQLGFVFIFTQLITRPLYTSLTDLQKKQTESLLTHHQTY